MSSVTCNVGRLSSAWEKAPRVGTTDAARDNYNTQNGVHGYRARVCACAVSGRSQYIRSSAAALKLVAQAAAAEKAVGI